MSFSKTASFLRFVAFFAVLTLLLSGGIALYAQTAELPTSWVNTHECDSTLTSPNQTINYPASGSGGSWAGGGPYAANSLSAINGLNKAIADAESYRNNNLSSGAVLIKIPAGALFSSGSAAVLPQTAGDASTNCIALLTTGTLPAGQTVCAHGVQDSISESTDVGTRNQGCNASGANDVAQMWTLEATATNVPALKTGSVDANGVAPHRSQQARSEHR